MKIGILTFHCAHNYGAVLQTYALQEYLKSLNFDVSIIDYQPDFLIQPYVASYFENIKSPNILKSVVKSVFELFYISIRKKRYCKFKRFIDTHLLVSNDNLYDVVVVGSDQVWNPNFNKGCFDLTYLGDTEKLNIEYDKIISYAASASITSFTESQLRVLNSKLVPFYAVSVRELSLKNILDSNIKGIQITHVLDPVLLVNPEVFRSLAKKTESIECTPILVYQVHKSKASKILSRKLSKTLKCPILEVASSIDYSLKPSSQLAEGPIDFVNHFMTAEFIVTTSFHGVVFSLLFEKPFYVIKINENIDSRVASLLDSLGLSDRHMSCDEVINIDEISYIDYSQVRLKLNLLRKSSREFLIKHI